MTDAPKKYEISKLTDLLSLTEDQRKRCVLDILNWCALHDEIRNLPLHGPETMTWVDDGAQDQLIRIKIPETEKAPAVKPGAWDDQNEESGQ